MIPYLSDSIRFYLRDGVDWDTYFSMRKGADADPQAEREALAEILGTAAKLCASMEPEMRAGWAQAAKLVDGEVVHPPHIARGYKALRGGRARLVRRRRAVRRLRPAGAHHEHALANDLARGWRPDDHHRFAGRRRRRHPALRQRGAEAALPPGLREGRDHGRDGSHRAASGFRPRRRSRRARPRKAARSSSTATRSSSPTAAPRCTSCSRATPTPSRPRRARRAGSRSTCARACCPTGARTA